MINKIFIWNTFIKKMVYLRITLPKADSKLDKEKETKKDFKEKNMNDDYVLQSNT